MPSPIGILSALLAAAPGLSPAQAPDEGALLFERHVLPTLRESCFECHGPAVNGPEGGLAIKSREALLAGGDGGPALVPGDAAKSELVRAIRYDDPFLSMPPSGKLPDDEIAAIERWVELGAPWPKDVDLGAPAEGGEAPVHERVAPPDEVTGRQWWSFRPVERPDVPAVDPARASTPIDAFLVHRLDELGIERNPPATKRELVRRAYHDLWGLPPTLAEVEAFVADDSPDAWPRLIDRLLASPRYAERWARHWLDLVRFAQTNGYERDAEKPFAWRYRDWVIDALDRDLPYDRFLVEQLAGDELPDDGSGSGAGALVATGFYRIGPWDDEPDDEETAVFDELDDTLRAISEGMLGVSLACARCHDHKFDPFRQADYYSTLAYLRGLRPYEDPVYTEDSATLGLLGDRATELQKLAAARAAEEQALESERDAILAEARRRVVKAGGKSFKADALREQLHEDERSRLMELVSRIDSLADGSFRGDSEWVLCAREDGTEPPDTHVLARGNASAKGDVVEPRPPAVLLPPGEDGAPAIVPPADGESSGRRLALARWIASDANPLTARALVNRVWQMHFGRALAPTPNDLGHAGMPPTHPELIDWLASAFTDEDGWSLKALHRRMMLSDAYRTSSRATNAAALAADEANDLLWRQRPRRMTAEELRDSALFVSGGLRVEDENEGERGGRGFFPRLSREALAGSSRPGLGWGVSPEAERARRAVYAFVKRGQPVPLFEAFDGPNATLPVGTRSVTTTSTQALVALNGAFMNERARALAVRVRFSADADATARVREAYRIVLAREPSEDELSAAAAFLDEQVRAFAAAPPDEIVVRPDVPPRIDASYLEQLSGEDVLLGPRVGWTAVRGRWGTPYNGTLQADELRGPALMLDDFEAADTRVLARVTLPTGGVLGLVVSATRIGGDDLAGIELRLDVARGTATVLQHGVRETKVLSEREVAIEPDEPFGLVLSVNRGELTATLDGAEAAKLSGVAKFRGTFALRAYGQGGSLANLRVTDLVTQASLRPSADPAGPPALRALEALCLALLNLNEFVYVD